MKPEGWIFMIATWSMVLGMYIFSYSRMFRKEEEKKRHNRTHSAK